jgi:hypothetical protein
MVEFSPAFLRSIPPQRLSTPYSDPYLASHGGTPSTQQRQRHGAAVVTMEQQPTYVVCKVSYLGGGTYSNRIREARVSKLGNILQEALNAIMGGPGDGGISRGYWDVECELKRFEESLTMLAQRTRDSVTLAQLRMEKREEKHTEEIGSKKLSEETGDGQGKVGGSKSGIGYKSEAPDSHHSRKSKILSLWVGEDTHHS